MSGSVTAGMYGSAVAAQSPTQVPLPRRQKFSRVPVEKVCPEDVPGSAAAAATRHACPAVLGPRVHGAAGPRPGAMTHAAVRHTPGPLLLVLRA
ncbi:MULTISPECIES: hypothetical protein [Streptomyces]|uniref:Uncharacterized protein n=1 Tax=Streptomyces gilvifuscus TaxID=1550617 RepID=A0ABT5FQP4_9ACTN|nr:MULTISPECIES: hypothetical protein [Streptomyces]MBK3643756.1 hypothetical protein [Streptomyces sp. MBT33]MDC2954793.1 hypothetical protein [Streptomyces gilvifuscus]